MTKKHWIILAAALLALGIIGVALVLALVLGFFAGHQEATADGSGLPVYASEQSASSHSGYRHSSLTRGNDVFVNDYEEAALQMMTSDPKPVIGRMAFGDGKICAIPSQPVTAYVAGDCGSEMPAYVPYRNIQQPPFDWRTASFREMTAYRPDRRDPYLTTTNAALLAELVRNLREGTSVELSDFPLAGVTNLTTIKMTSDQLPGLMFCPSVYYYGNGTIYLAESLMMDPTATPPQLHACWIPASPMLTQWLKSP